MWTEVFRGHWDWDINKYVWRNSFWIIENFTSKNSQIAFSIEETSKEWIFFIVNDTKSFLKSEYSVIQSFDMMYPYKWAIADALSGKNIFGTLDPSYNQL